MFHNYYCKKICKIILLWVIIVSSIYLFEITYRSQFNELELYSGGVYRDTPFFYLPISVILALLVGWISTRFSEEKFVRIISYFVYVFFYICMCIIIADESKQLLGTTWSSQDILFELILNKWYFYVFAIIGLTTLIFLNKLNPSKKQWIKFN